MRKLFVSFTAVIHRLANGTDSDDDLAVGLYYFGCSRAHAFGPGRERGADSNEVKWLYKNAGSSFNADDAAVAHRRLVTALERAEADGRAIWRQHGEGKSYARLNELLTRNGFALLPESGDYKYRDVESRVRDANLPLEVVR